MGDQPDSGQQWQSRAGSDTADVQRDANYHSKTKEYGAHLVGSAKSVEDLAEVLRANPTNADAIVREAMAKFGNAGVMKALELAGNTDHSIGTDRSSMKSGGNSSVVDKAAPSPSSKLPFTADGWNALEINQKLGQHDKITGTDNDGDRCTFASALAMKIFDGPDATVSWMEALLTKYDSAEGRKGKEAGEDVLRAVIAAIRGKTASYGDLSWAQEAIYEITMPKGQVGTAGVKQKDWVGRETTDYSISDDMPTQSMASTVYGEADLVKVGKTLEPGEKLMCGWITADFSHQLMIANHDGNWYVYDSEKQEGGGSHLTELNKKNVAKYFANYASVDTYLKVLAPKKATLDGAPKKGKK